MQVNLQCQACGNIFQVSQSAAGSSFQCGCGQWIVVPDSNPAHKSKPVPKSKQGAVPPKLTPHSTSAPPKPSMPEPLPPKPQMGKPGPVYSPQTQPYSAQPAPRRGGSGLLIGCLGTLVVLGICVVAVFLVVRKVKTEVTSAMNQLSGWVGMIDGLQQLANLEEIIEEYEAKGYERIEAQVRVEDTPIDNKRLYICQMLDIKTDVHDDIAILAQVATVHGTVHGNLDFGGQALIIEKDAVIKGNVYSRLGQIITIKGTVEGKLTGAYQALDANPNRIKGGTEGTQKTFDSVRSLLAQGPSQRNRQQMTQSELDEMEISDAQVRAAAKELISGRNSIAHRNGLEQLAKLTPNDQDRALVIKLITPHLGQMMTRDEALSALEVWGDKTAAPLVIDVIKKNRLPTGDDYVQLLVEWDAQDEVLTLINHKDSSISRIALDSVTQWDLDDEKIARQCLADIKRRSGGLILDIEEALVNLSKLDLEDESLKRDVSTVLIPLLSGLQHHKLLSEILEKTVNKDDVDLLLKQSSLMSRFEYFSLLALTQSPKAYEHIVMQAIKGHNLYAERVLKSKVREVAEPYIWPHLEEHSHTSRRACDLLGEFGTEKSLEHLQPLTDNVISRSSATRAIEKIQKRLEEDQ